jgi:hypothetical protein
MVEALVLFLSVYNIPSYAVHIFFQGLFNLSKLKFFLKKRQHLLEDLRSCSVYFEVCICDNLNYVLMYTNVY